MDITATLMQPLRSKYGNLDKNVQRVSQYGALELFKKQTADPTGILTEEDKTNIKNSFGNSVQIPVIDYTNVTLSNVRSCAMQVGGINSKLVNVTFATVAFGIALAPAMYENNTIGYKTAFTKQLEAGLIKTAALLDTTGTTHLNTNKNQYFPAALTKYYAQVANAFQVPLAAQGDYWNYIPAIMSEMDFGGVTPEVLTDPMGTALVRKLAANGQNNATNTAYQVLNTDYYESNRVTSGAGVRSTQYLVAPGNLGFVNRLDPDSRMGNKSTTGKEWGIARNLPIIGLDMGVLYQSDCSDQSAAQAAGLTGLTATLVESWQYSMDYAFISAYNDRPTTDYSPILKVELLNS